jgi:hypothetical protein
MGGLLLSVNAFNPYGTSSTINYEIIIVDDKGWTTKLPIQTAAIINGGSQVWIAFAVAQSVKEIAIAADSMDTAISLFEVAFRACPPDP